jgi:hypothetical protein
MHATDPHHCTHTLLAIPTTPAHQATPHSSAHTRQPGADTLPTPLHPAAHGSLLARRSLPMDSMMAAHREGDHLSPGSTPTSRDQGSLGKTSLSHSW